MKFLRRSTLVALVSIVLWLPAMSQVRTYDVITASVPFKFTVGDRAFRPGQYEFIVVGVGLLAVRNEQRHVIAALVTRSVETGEPSLITKLVFNKKKNRSQLVRIALANQSQALEVIGEQLAIRSSPSPQSPSSDSLPIDATSLFGGRNGIRLRQ